MTHLNGYTHTEPEDRRVKRSILAHIDVMDENKAASQLDFPAARRLMNVVAPHLSPSYFDSAKQCGKLLASIRSAAADELYKWRCEAARLTDSDIDAITRIVVQSIIDNVLELSYVETVHSMKCPNCGNTMPLSKWMAVEIGGGPFAGPMDNAIAPDTYAGRVHCGRATLADKWEEVDVPQASDEPYSPADSQPEPTQFMRGVKR